MRMAILVAAGMALGLATVLAGAELSWRRATAGLVARLGTPTGPAPAAAPFSLSELEGLPAPVGAYFRAVLRGRQPVVARVEIQQEGEFLVRPPATTVSLDFRFSVGGLVESVYTPTRSRDVAGVGVPTPWEGRWSDYGEREGMLIPLRGEVAWLLPEGPQPYWRGRVTAVRTDNAGGKRVKGNG